MTVEELQVLITANTADLRKEINRVEGSLSSMQKETTKTTNAIGSGFKFLKTTIIGLGIGKVIKSIFSNMDGAVSRLDTLNGYSNVMSNLGVSAEDSDASIKRLSDKLTGLPTTLDAAAQSVQRFTSANGNVKASTDMFLALNNAILAGGASTEIQESALEQLSQAYAKGSMDMEEWRSAMTAMPAQLKQVAQSMGYVSADEMGEALRTGSLSMNEFMVQLMKLNKEGVNGFQSFEKQAGNSTNGVATSIANVKTALTRGLAEIMNAIGQSNISAFFQGIADIINKVVPYITGFVKACSWAVSYITKLFGGKSSTKKDVEKTSGAVQSLGASGVSASKGLDTATGSAKKLKKELGSLASFDEITLLDDNSGNDGGDSGSSSSGSGVGDLGELDFSDWDTGMNNAGSKADEVAEKIKKAFMGVGDVISKVWNSEPVQAYVGYIDSAFTFIKDLGVRLGTDLWTNMTNTWKNIEGNVRVYISNISDLFTHMFDDVADGIDKWGPRIIDGIAGIFNSIWADAIDPACQLITQAWADFSGILLEKWNEYGQPLIDNIGEFYVKTIEIFQKIWDDVIEPIVTPFLENLSWLWDKHLSGMIEKIADFIGKLVNGALDIYNGFIQPIVSWLMDIFAPVWSFLSEHVIGTLGSFLGYIFDVAGSIFGVLGGIIDFITGVFSGDWDKAWNGIKDIFSNIIDGLAAIFKLPINLIIDGINGFVAGINKIKIPDWVPGVGGKGFDIPKLKKLARGGVVDKPTPALIGEAGKEVVMPLENNTGWIDNLAAKLNGGANVDLMLELINAVNNLAEKSITLEVNGQEIARATYDDFKDEEGRRNPSPTVRRA